MTVKKVLQHARQTGFVIPAFVFARIDGILAMNFGLFFRQLSILQLVWSNVFLRITMFDIFNQHW
jgi:hypothetical protein